MLLELLGDCVVDVGAMLQWLLLLFSIWLKLLQVPSLTTGEDATNVGNN